MADLIYASMMSLDGYIEDATGKFDWAMPSEQVHAYMNDLSRPIETQIYGRKLYEVMVFWETVDAADEPPVVAEFAEIWRGCEKVVVSRTLQEVSSERTRLIAEFDVEAIQRLKSESKSDIAIGGAELASAAFAADLIDRVELTVFPVSVGGGKPALPRDQRIDLQLMDQTSFDGGVSHLSLAVNR